MRLPLIIAATRTRQGPDGTPMHDGMNQCQECARLGVARYTNDPGQLCRKHRRAVGAY